MLPIRPGTCVQGISEAIVSLKDQQVRATSIANAAPQQSPLYTFPAGCTAIPESRPGRTETTGRRRSIISFYRRTAGHEQVLQRFHLLLLDVQQFGLLLVTQDIHLFMQQHDLEFGFQIDFVVVLGGHPVLV